MIVSYYSFFYKQIMPSSKNLEAIAEELGVLLLHRAWTVTTAESCTGGGISQTITAIPGSSAWFETGFVTYSNQAKNQQLGIATALIQNHGAVSSEVASAMAKGALIKSGANFSVAVTGIAGPGGGSQEKPVGTVWIACANNTHCFSQLFHFDGDRNSVRYQSIEQSLLGLISVIKKNTV